MVLGSGGREHALVWQLSRSGVSVECAPGSDAISRLCPVWKFSDFNDLAAKVKAQKIEEVIVGPEKYLAEGITDELVPQGISVFGPSQIAAKLETDKAWAKDFLLRHQIPTARSKTARTPFEVQEALKSFRSPYVVKASGLAAGKGVWIGTETSEAIEFAKNALPSHKSVVIEEFLEGEEVSYFLMIDQDHHLFLGTAQDHKRLSENDTGPNTGGMGTYAPIPIMNAALEKKIEEKIVLKCLEGLRKDGIVYRGFLFIGLMIVNEEPYVLEFNCRLGDPETQSLMLLLQSPLYELIASLKKNPLRARFDSGVAINVVLAAKGYPDSPLSGFEIPHLDLAPKDIVLFHSGTEWGGKNWVARGGRLIGVATKQDSLMQCQQVAYSYIESLPFLDKISYRKDIGMKAFKHLYKNA